MSVRRSGRIALWLRLARRFTRTKPMRRSSAIVFVTAAVLMVVFVSLHGFSQTGAQVVEQDLGRFSARVALGEGYGLGAGEDGAVPELIAAAHRAGAADAAAMLESFDVQPAIGDPPSATMFLEADWASRPFPDRYSLTDGRWPAAPGEAVMTSSLAESTKHERTVPILAGNERLRVVGTVKDRYATASSKILAARGTWRSFDAHGLAARYPNLGAAPTLLWSGHDARVLRALSSVARPNAGATDLSGEPLAVGAQLSQNLRTRASELAKPRQTWLDRIPIAYGLPSIGLPLLAVIAGFAINTRRLRRNLGTLRAIGVGATDATAAVVLAGSAWFLAAALAGAALGAALGFPARLVGQAFLARPLSPFPELGAPALRLLAVVSVSCLGVGIATMLGQRRSTTRSLLSALPRGRSVSNIRHALATVAGAVAVWQVVSLDTVDEAMVLVATTAVLVTLMTPEVVQGFLHRLPAPGPRRRLARQQLLFDRGRVLVCVALLTAALGPALGMVTLLDTLIASDAKSAIPDVAPRQVVLQSADGSPLHAPPGDLVRNVVSTVDPHAPPVRVAYAASERTNVNVEGDDLGWVIAVDSVEDASRLNNGALTSEQRRALEQGGLLTWAKLGDRSTRRLVVSDAATGKRRSQTTPLPAAVGPFERTWQDQSDGLMLSSTAKRLGLPLSHSEIVLTGVSDESAAKAQQVALDGGYDPHHVGVNRAPDRAEVPLAFWGAIGGLGVLVLLTVFTVSRAQATTLRGYLGGLVAIGLSPRWARDVLTLQTALLVVISAMLGLVIGLAPVGAAALQVPGLSLAIPWWSLAGVIGLFAAAAWLAITLSSSNLRASDRSGVPT